jgi:NAD(P)-dependent dehydrogenase (short-subunit alcohol dehydrogenase family)
LSDPGFPYCGNSFFANNSSKSALNGLTLAFAKDLVGDGITVNERRSSCPKSG